MSKLSFHNILRLTWLNLKPKERVKSLYLPTDKLIISLFNISFRLSGNHKDAYYIVRKALAINNLKNNDPNWALKCLGDVFRERYELSRPAYLHSRDYHDKTQHALLSLRPMERLVVVLRDIAGLKYSDIAYVANIKEIDVNCYLVSARRSLLEMLR